MATPKKLPSGKWRVLVFSHYENGKRKYVSFTADTKQEANRLAVEYQNRTITAPVQYTARECVEKYVDLKRSVLSPSTIDGYVKLIKNYDFFGSKPISKITDADIQAFINNLTVDKSPKTVRNIYGLLSTSLNFYLHKNYYVSLPKKVHRTRNTPISEEVRLLMENASPKLKICIALASTATLRRGEICALKYKDIDFIEKTVFVHSDMVKSVNGWVHKEIPKTDTSIRRVPLTDEVLSLIPQGNQDDYIISWTPASLTKRFCDLRNSLGLKCRFHDLRAYSATVLHTLGVPTQYILKWGGWKTDHVLKEAYLDTLSDEEKRFNQIALDYFRNVM